MAKIHFYEKPGCATNARQKAMLKNAGHRVEARSLLTELWTKERLASFLIGLPVNQWFNLASPRVKSGEINPSAYDSDSALALLVNDPLLIRRPLMEVGDWRSAGFDAAVVNRAIGLPLSDSGEPMEGCTHSDSSRSCPTPVVEV